MLGAKLRSERLDKYDALGERGQPVYQAASQILTTLGRHRPDAARHFAVPQLSEDSTSIDWYAPHEGAVIPWSAATEAERQEAAARLAEVQTNLAFLATDLQDNAAQNGGSLFARMLKWMPQYPDSSHVYIVDGRPVITFWGFQAAGAGEAAPLLTTLVPAAGEKLVVPARTEAQVEEARAPLMGAAPLPAAAPAAVVATTPWWKRWWLWLLLLLLALLLLFGLRGCIPSLNGGMPSASGGSWPNFSLPNFKLPFFNRPSLPAVNLPSVGGLPSGAGSSSALGGATGSAAAAPAGSSGIPNLPALPEAGAPGDNSANPPTLPDATPETAEPAPAEPVTPPTLGPDANPANPPAPPTLPTDAAASPEPLVIPPDHADGPADFLNGDWGVRAGIQDRNTGQPLRLHYRFQDGQGEVTLARHNGVVCSAPVSAAMVGGALAITNGADASCSDGQTFEMPAIHCAPGASQTAACQGRYGNDNFPLSMSQSRP